MLRFRLYSQFHKIQPRTSWEEACTLDFDLLTDTVNPFCSDSLSHPQEETGFKNVSALYSPGTMWFKLQFVSQHDLFLCASGKNWKNLQTLPSVFSNPLLAPSPDFLDIFPVLLIQPPLTYIYIKKIGLNYSLLKSKCSG